MGKILPPLQLDGSRSTRLASFSPSQVYDQFLLSVQSRSLHRAVLEEQGILATLDANASAEERGALDEAFLEWEAGFSLKDDVVGADEPGFVQISQVGGDPIQITAFLNRVAELAASTVLDNLKRVVATRIDNRRKEIDTILKNLRARAGSIRADEISRMEEAQAIEAGRLDSLIEARRHHMTSRNTDQVARLKEAIAIAENAGLQEPMPGLGGSTSFVALGRESGSDNIGEAGQLRPTRIDINATPLFFRGAKMLKAELLAIEGRTSSDPFVEDLRVLEEQLQQVMANPELGALRARKSDDPFIQGLRELEIEDQALAAIQLPVDGLAAMAFDQRALPPRRPTSGWMYVLPGLMLGAVAGVIFALLQRVLRLQRGSRSPI
jgi:LPS O-antigen subunit length determinant protein (WzzB/FepE family)